MAHGDFQPQNLAGVVPEHPVQQVLTWLQLATGEVQKRMEGWICDPLGV